MRTSIQNYKSNILRLPIKEKYEKSELLTKEFLLEQEGEMEIYYTPHNEYTNQAARVCIVGITPGFQQMSTAITVARKELELGTNMEEIQYKCKVAGRFSGSLRKNIISMLDEIKLQEQ